MPLFLLLLTVPLIEIGLFVVIGGEIGLWPTLALVLTTAIVGATAIRSQGRQVMAQMGRLSDPSAVSSAVLNGAFIVVAGLLLLTPGFLTDSIGLSLLVPPIRSAIVRRAAERAMVFAMRGGAGPRAGTAETPGPAEASAQGDDAEERAAHPTSDPTARPRKPIGRPSTDADDAVVIDPKNEPRP